MLPVRYPVVIIRPWSQLQAPPPAPLLLDGYVPGEGLVLLLLDLQLRCLQAQGFPGLRLLDAAIAQAAPALLHLGRQPPTAALHWIVAAHGTNREERKR